MTVLMAILVLVLVLQKGAAEQESEVSKPVAPPLSYEGYGDSKRPNYEETTDRCVRNSHSGAIYLVIAEVTYFFPFLFFFFYYTVRYIGDSSLF